MVSTSYIRRKNQSLNLVDRLSRREAVFPLVNCSPNLWTRALIDDTIEHSSSFYYKDLLAHYGCVNSVEFSPDGALMASGGDDKRILLWNVWEAVHKQKYVPMEMKSSHNSNIFCISFDAAQKRIFSGGNDELVIVHNIETKEAIDVISHMDDVYGLDVDPTDSNLFASSSNEVMIWDLRSGKSTTLAVGSGPFHGVMYNPQNSNLVATANSRDGIAVYDTRRPTHKLLYFYSSSIVNSQSAMCVQFNKAGNLLLALRRRRGPVLYELRSPYPLVEFDSEDYYNSCTLKNCSFVGQNDQFVASGSDNFKVFLWKIPEEITNGASKQSPLKNTSVLHVPEATQILNGHRSIVNQVCFNERNGMVASAGVEKMIKLWSPIVQFDESHKVNSRETNFTSVERSVFSYQEYLDLVHSDRLYVAHDYSANNIAEDRRMIAYFDSMVERDITNSNWGSSSEDEVPSYFNYLSKHEFNYGEHMKTFSVDSSDEAAEVAFREISNDSGEMFALQKRFNFSKSFSTNGFDEDDYLAYVFAKRMHARYITSFVSNLIEQIERMNGDGTRVDPSKSQASTSGSSQRPESSGQSSDTVGKSSNGPSSSRANQQSPNSATSPETLNLANINQSIKSKKDNSLIFFAYKFSNSLLLSFQFGTLFEMSKNKFLQEYSNETAQLNSKANVQGQIKKMSRLKEKNVCDKRLFNILNNLYKRVLHLLNLLNDSHNDIKARCEEFIKNLKAASARRHLYSSLMADSDSDSELGVEDEHEEEDIVMEFSEEARSSDSASLSSSTTLSSSYSSSSSSDMSEDESKAEKKQRGNLVTSTLSCSDSVETKEANSTAETSLQKQGSTISKPADVGETILSGEQGPSNGIIFKRINKNDRKSRNYRKSPKKRRKVCKNKRQRKS